MQPWLITLTAVSLIALLAGPALAQDQDPIDDPTDAGATHRIVVPALLVLAGIAAIVVVLTIAWRAMDASHSNVHRMRRRYFETCNRRRRAEHAAGTRNGAVGP